MHRPSYKNFIGFFFIGGWICWSAASPPSSAELISSVQHAAPASSINIGIKINLKKNWHTYWQNPGDIGRPLEVQWNVSPKVQISSLKWPIPQRIPYSRWINFAYKDQLILLTRFDLPPNITTNSLVIQAQVQWLACEKVCIPFEKNLNLTLPISSSTVSNPRFKNMLENVKFPTISDFKGVFDKKNLQLRLSSQTAFQFLDFFPLDGLPSSDPSFVQNTPSSVVLTFSKNPNKIKKTIKLLWSISKKEKNKLPIFP